MKKLMKRTLLATFAIIIGLVSFCYALNPDSHKEINKHIALNTINGFSLDSYLKDRLGFQGGIEESFDKQKVWEWLRDGGRYEDLPPYFSPPFYLRSVNHFHNPLTEQGFSGFIWGTFLEGMSSTQWALLPEDTQSALCWLLGCYSWDDVREYYYTALTSTDQDTRNTNFADTFRGVGQLMHLIHDASVPAHTRNDFHVFYNYEKWVKKEANIANYNPVNFSGTINDIASFIDTNQYNGADPNIAVGTNIGLSEYTNANFFSEDTINSSSFTYPQTQGMPIELRNFTNPDLNTTYPRRYYLKNCCGETNGGQGYLLSAVDYLDYYRQQNPALSFALKEIPVLDNNVYSDYASFLIPRAVGYSAGLLDYFFRGNINIIQTGADTFQIVNLSDEDMEGNLNSFRIFYDDINDNRIEIPLAFYDNLGNQYTNPDTILSIPSQGKSLFTVELQSVPVNPKNPGEYILVFKGRIGNEGVAPYDTEYAVAAQKITPHFLIHVYIPDDNQWDVYEYDLLGNRIYNVTGELTRGEDYYDGNPNPVDPDKLIFLSSSGCISGGSCLYRLTKSTGQVVNMNRSGIFWWSKDGRKIYEHEGINGDFYIYDLETDTWDSINSYGCGYYNTYSSFSYDETKLVSEGLYPSISGPLDYFDVVILTKSANSWDLTHVIDMDSMSLKSVDTQTCDFYRVDEDYMDAVPDFHPSEDKIIFTSDKDWQWNIYKVNFNIGIVEDLTYIPQDTLHYYEAVWSPDGEKIIMAGRPNYDPGYPGDPGNISEIFLMPPSGGTPTQITSDGVEHYYPRWIRYLGQ